MNLLYPELLWGLTLLIFPILIHLFNLQKHKTVYFSDISLLKQINQSTKKRSQIKNILVLLSRIGMISSIVIAFCFPYNKSNKVDLKKNSIGIYFDNTFSMERQGETSSLMNQAKDDAYSLIDAHEENTDFFLLTNSKNFGSNNKLTKQQIIDLIAEIQPSQEVLSYGNILMRQSEQIKSEASFYWFTDLQKTSLIDQEIMFDSLSKVNIIRYKGLNNNNLYIDSIWFDDNNRKINQAEELNISVINNTQQKFDFTAVLDINEKEVISQRSFNINPLEKLIIKLNYKVKNEGLKSCHVKLEDYPSPDHLFDDDFYFTYWLKKEFKILHAYGGVENSYSKINSLFKTIENTEIKSIDINNKIVTNYNDYDMIILDGISDLNNEIYSAISSYLNSKKTVVLIPSIKKLNIKTFNESLTFLNINLEKRDSTKSILKEINKNNLFFKNVFEKSNYNVSLPYYKSHYTINKSANLKELLKFENSDPLLLTKNYKGGEFYFFTANMSISNSDITEHSLFVPLFLRILEKANNYQKLYYGLENNLFIESNLMNVIEENINISSKIDPSINFIPTTKKFNGKNYYDLEKNLLKAGNFNINSLKETVDGFSLNYDRCESNMDFFTKEEFNQEIYNADLGNQIKIYDDSNNRISNLIRSKITGEFYWKYFIILTLLFIILEIIIIRITTRK
jgi:hypothetical protein